MCPGLFRNRFGVLYSGSIVVGESSASVQTLHLVETHRTVPSLPHADTGQGHASVSEAPTPRLPELGPRRGHSQFSAGRMFRAWCGQAAGSGIARCYENVFYFAVG